MKTEPSQMVVLMLGMTAILITGCGNFKSKWGCKGLSGSEFMFAGHGGLRPAARRAGPYEGGW